MTPGFQPWGWTNFHEFRFRYFKGFWGICVMCSPKKSPKVASIAPSALVRAWTTILVSSVREPPRLILTASLFLMFKCLCVCILGVDYGVIIVCFVRMHFRAIKFLKHNGGVRAGVRGKNTQRLGTREGISILHRSVKERAYTHAVRGELVLLLLVIQRPYAYTFVGMRKPCDCDSDV